MKTRSYVAFFWLRSFFSASVFLALAFGAPAQHAIMHMTAEQKARLVAEHLQAPQLASERGLQSGFGSSLNLLSRLPYVPAERNQGWCGDCWQWAGTGVLEIAHTVQSGVYDRLSVQFINSCESGDCGCSGGWLSQFASFYSAEGFAIPWTNQNAQYYQGYPSDGTCGNMPACGTIATAPRYPITSIADASIATLGVGQAQAIANIKNVLNQNEAIWFAFFMPETAWDSFYPFWDNQPESVTWTNFPCGQESGSGHAVVCVGYNDDDPANPYWIMVNSWGTTPQRPNGIFHVTMNLNYDCADASGYANLFWQTLEVQFGDRVPGAPIIYQQPTGQTVAPGGNASFTVGASGTAPLSYFWLRNGTPIAGANLSTYTTTNVQPADAGSQFSCLVSNANGTTLSSAATLVVLSGTTDLIKFDDLASAGTPPVPNGYHGLTWTNLILSDAHASVNGGYHAGMISASNVVFNGAGNPASLTSTGSFNLISAYLTAAWNDNLQFEAKGYVGSTLTYDQTYTLSATASTLIYFNYSGVSRVVFVSSGGTTHPGYTGTGTHFVLDNLAISADASGNPPTVTGPPANVSTNAGATVAFSVSASGAAPLSYFWRRNSTPIAGANQSSYTLANVQPSDSGSQFSCLVSNAYGSALSSAAALVVLSAGVDLIQFDDLAGTSMAPVPNNYHALTWNNLVVTDAHASTNGGYRSSMISPSNVVFNALGAPASVTSSAPFNFISAYLTAAWNDNLQLEARGYVAGSLTYDHTYTLSATAPTLIYFNYTGVSEVDFISSGGTAHPGYSGSGTHFVLDNLAVSPASSGSPPIITASPASVTTNAGASVAFSVSASGTGPLSYFWCRNNTPIAGATQSSYTASNVQLADSGSQFSCLVSNAVGTTNSSAATLTVVPLPALAVTPGSLNWGSVPVGTTNSQTLYVTNAGGGTLSGSASVSAPFAVASGASYSLATGQGQPVVVSYSPTAPGTNSAVVSFTGGGGATVGVSGVATAIPPANLFSFTNRATIVINDAGPGDVAAAATPFPSSIAVAGLSGAVSNATVALLGFSHTYPHDAGVLLVGPQGQKLVVMANSGGYGVTNLTLTFDDHAATGLIEYPAGPLVSGTYRPSNCGSGDTNFPAGAPAGPYATALSVCNGADPNGVWSLYVQDDSHGDAGSIANGWSLTFNLVTAPSLPVITTPPQPQAVIAGWPAAFALTAANAQSYRWQMNGTNLADGGRISGSTTPRLTIANTQTNDSRGQLSCLVSNVNGGVCSSNVLLTVYPASTSLFGGCTRSNGQVQLTFYGALTSNYVIYVSADLKAWKVLTTVTTTNGCVIVADPSTGLNQRFYRAKPQ